MGCPFIPCQKAVGVILESLAITLRNEGFKQNHQNDLKKSLVSLARLAFILKDILQCRLSSSLTELREQVRFGMASPYSFQEKKR